MDTTLAQIINELLAANMEIARLRAEIEALKKEVEELKNPESKDDDERST